MPIQKVLVEGIEVSMFVPSEEEQTRLDEIHKRGPVRKPRVSRPSPHRGRSLSLEEREQLQAKRRAMFAARDAARLEEGRQRRAAREAAKAAAREQKAALKLQAQAAKRAAKCVAEAARKAGVDVASDPAVLAAKGTRSAAQGAARAEVRRQQAALPQARAEQREQMREAERAANEKFRLRLAMQVAELNQRQFKPQSTPATGARRARRTSATVQQPAA